MNIAFDMSIAKGEAWNRGMGRYSKNLIQHIVMQDVNDAHSFFYFYPDVTKGEVHLRDQLQKFITNNKIDVFHILSPFENFHQQPFVNYHMLHREWFGTVKVVATFYDLIPMLYPEHYLTAPGVKEVFYKITDFICSCDLVFAISETTKEDAVQHLEIAPEKIKVIMAGIDEQFTIQSVVDRVILKQKYVINRPYVICTGGTDFRKNLAGLIKGFGCANAVSNHSFQLVIVCDISSYDRQQLMEVAVSVNALDDLVLTGYVPDDDLVVLYNGAEILAFPSLYEGFGFPVLEAMNCGVPVLTSNTSSLSEISGDAAYLVNPHSVDEISAGLGHLMQDSDLRAALRKKGFTQVTKFQWSRVAQRVLEGYARVTRKKIAIFSPLPPIRSEIAVCMEALLPSLSNHYDCDLYIDDEYIPQFAENVKCSVNILHHSVFNQQVNQYEAILYQLGDSLHYSYMIPYLRKYSGIVIIHNLHLHELTLQWTLYKNNLNGYYEVLKESFGEQADAILDDILESNMTSQYTKEPLFQYYLQNAKFIVVHNELSKNMLNQKGYNGIVLDQLPGQSLSIYMDRLRELIEVSVGRSIQG